MELIKLIFCNQKVIIYIDIWITGMLLCLINNKTKNWKLVENVFYNTMKIISV